MRATFMVAVVFSAVCWAGCDEDEGVVCASDEVIWADMCIAAADCPGPFYTVCQDPNGSFVCVDTSADPIHCGGCGNTCFSDEICAFGVCQVATYSCADFALVECGNACVNIVNDIFNCGGCGNVCAFGDICVASACQTTGYACESVGLVQCGYGCVDITSDPYNCGGCGIECRFHCVNGVCPAG
jgi:hypothetical protein